LPGQCLEVGFADRQCNADGEDRGQDHHDESERDRRAFRPESKRCDRKTDIADVGQHRRRKIRLDRQAHQLEHEIPQGTKDRNHPRSREKNRQKRAEFNVILAEVRQDQRRIADVGHKRTEQLPVKRSFQ